MKDTNVTAYVEKVATNLNNKTFTIGVRDACICTAAIIESFPPVLKAVLRLAIADGPESTRKFTDLGIKSGKMSQELGDMMCEILIESKKALNEVEEHNEQQDRQSY